MIRIGGQLSIRVIIGRGLLQGSLLSPFLFNIFTDTLPRLLRRKHPSFLLGGCKIDSPLYADDTVLVSNTKDHLQSMLETCELLSKEYGYEFSPPKCEIVTPSDEQDPYFRMYGEHIRLTPSFKYLGVPVTKKGIDISGLCHGIYIGLLKQLTFFIQWDAMERDSHSQ